MDRKRLNKILDKHKNWLHNKKGGERADFRGANLDKVDFCEANLREAAFNRVSLRQANLNGANLYMANFNGAALNGANLNSANIRKANFYGGALYGASLKGADIRETDLRLAALYGVDLCGADLRGANLEGADLDYSCWPLWQGSLDVKVDARIARQLAYHFCRLDCDDPEYLEARKAIAKFANGFYKVYDYGRIKEE